MPIWMFNRRNDIYTGENRHLLGTDLILGVKEDINLMKKMQVLQGYQARARPEGSRPEDQVNRQDRSDRRRRKEERSRNCRRLGSVLRRRSEVT